MIEYCEIDSPLGAVRLTSAKTALTGLYFIGQKYEKMPGPDWVLNPGAKIFEDAGIQLSEYFSSRRKSFDLPLKPTGTPFQEKVWRAIAAIPFGETRSYRDLAERAGNIRAVRAVGAAVGRNPLSVIIPCHRVVGRDGSLTGYAGGLDRKKALLKLEGAGWRQLEN